MALIENPRAVYGLFAILSQRNKLKTAAVCFAALIFSGLLVKEWLAVKEADAIEAKSGRPPRKADPGFAATMADIFDFKPMHAQERFFYRVRAGDLYQPDPMIQKLDLDDPKIALEYQRDVTSFTKRLRELNIDINTVLVKPNPANIRVLTLQEGNPVKVWTLYLLTGEDTAQQLDDGIHLRRRGFVDKIVGWPVGEKDERGYSEASSVLWRPNGRGGWNVDDNGSNAIRWVSVTTLSETEKIRSPQVGGATEKTTVRYMVDCAALRQFARPLQPGETTREITLKVDVPVSPGAGNPPCMLRPDSLVSEHASEPPLRSSNPPPPRNPDEPGAEVVTVVDARKMWTSTGITVARGQGIRLRAIGTVTGATSRRDAAFRLVGPAGWGNEPQFISRRYNLVLGHGSSYMCLVAKIGDEGEPFNAGSATPMSFTSSTPGTLYFGVNDALAPNDPELYFRDNGGSFKVTVTIEQSH